MASVSIYYFAGDFLAAYENHREGQPQAYATHDEVMHLTRDLLDAGHSVRLSAFLSEGATVDRPERGLEIVGLGGTSHGSAGLLAPAVRDDRADFIVPHFPNTELLGAAIASPARVMAMFASSYNGGVRTRLEARRIVKLANDPRIEWVANHCRPSTTHLAQLGVSADKLIAWDVPHGGGPPDPSTRPHPGPGTWTAFYAGAITESKGVGDVVRSLAVLRRLGHEVRFEAVGGGDVDAIAGLARRLGVDDLVDLLGPRTNDEVRERMRAADLVVVPSRHDFPEGMPLTLFEAVSSGTPLVCSDHPMFVEDFVDGRSAATFAAHDPADLARAIVRVRDDAGLYESLSRHAPSTWRGLRRTADMRTLLTRWVEDPPPSAWIADHSYRALSRRSG